MTQQPTKWVRVSLCLAPSDYQHLREIAANEGLCISEYIRTILDIRTRYVEYLDKIHAKLAKPSSIESQSPALQDHLDLAKEP